MMKHLWVYGAGGHARVVYDVVSSMKEYFILGFIDDDKSRRDEVFIGCDLKNSIPDEKKRLQDSKSFNLFVAIGDNVQREKIAEQNSDYTFPILIHPTAVIGREVKIGHGTIIMPGAVIESRAKIGRHCIINNGAIIGHCSDIKDYCHISGNSVVSGEVIVGKYSLVGIGSCITPQTKIGMNCILGAGSVVTRDVPDAAKMFGNPARNISNFF